MLHHEISDTCAEVDLNTQIYEMLPEGLQDLDQPVCPQVRLSSHQYILHNPRGMFTVVERLVKMMIIHMHTNRDCTVHVEFTVQLMQEYCSVCKIVLCM